MTVTLRERIVDARNQLKVYMLAKGLWTPFKLIIAGIAYLYGGTYTIKYAPAWGYYGSIFMLIGVFLIGFGLYKVKAIREFFEGVL